VTTPTPLCASLLLGKRMRVTKVDGCGRPVTGSCSVVTSKGFVTVKLSPEIEKGNEITQKNAAGEVCVSAKLCDTIKWWSVEIEFCSVDPDLMGITAPNWPKELDYAGNPAGVRITKQLSCDTGFALEVWSDVEGGDACADPNVPGQWGYFLIPWLTGSVPGDVEIGADAIDFTITATTKDNPGWAKGPHHVVLNPVVPPATEPAAGPLLTPVAANEQVLIQVTTVPPPAAVCGCQALPA
jgi:hypothetical protein